MGNKKGLFIVVPGSIQTEELSIETRWMVNNLGVFQQSFIEDAVVFKKFTEVDNIYVSFHYLSNSQGTMLRIFSGLIVDGRGLQKTSYFQVNTPERKQILATLLETKKYFLHFINTRTERVREYAYSLDDTHLQTIARCLQGLSQPTPQQPNLDFVIQELDKRFPISNEVQMLWMTAIDRFPIPNYPNMN